MLAGAYVLGTAVTAAGPIAAVWRRQRMAWGGVVTRAMLCVVMSILLAVWLPAPAEPAAGVALHVVVAVVALALTATVLWKDLGAAFRATRRLV